VKRALAPVLLAAVLAGACAHRSPGLAGSGHGTAPDSAAVVAMLGGMQNAACPLPGVATGGQPDSTRYVALAGAGFHTVIDLRMPDEPRGYDEPSVVRAANLEYRSLPVSAATLSDSTFDAFRALMQERGRESRLVHCHSGNRVGALMVPWLVLDRGWTVERAVAAAEAGGLRTPALRERALDYVRRRTSR
jgi:protein tyrosine phosphatase (PTP) superfamily phosphohydrolase (DUF442 family)